MEGITRWEETEELYWYAYSAKMRETWPELAGRVGRYTSREWPELDPPGVDWLPGFIEPLPP